MVTDQKSKHSYSYQTWKKKKKDMNWISVKDRLPAIGQNVLVWDGNTNLDNIPTYELAKYLSFNNGNFFISGPYSLQAITHWMPLPEPPKD